MIVLTCNYYLVPERTDGVAVTALDVPPPLTD